MPGVRSRTALVDSVPVHFIMHWLEAAFGQASISAKFRSLLDFRSPMRHKTWPAI